MSTLLSSGFWNKCGRLYKVALVGVSIRTSRDTTFIGLNCQASQFERMHVMKRMVGYKTLIGGLSVIALSIAGCAANRGCRGGSCGCSGGSCSSPSYATSSYADPTYGSPSPTSGGMPSYSGGSGSSFSGGSGSR